MSTETREDCCGRRWCDKCHSHHDGRHEHEMCNGRAATSAGAIGTTGIMGRVTMAKEDK